MRAIPGAMLLCLLLGLAAPGCGTDEPVGAISLDLTLRAVDPGAVGSLTIYVLGNKACIDLYSGDVDPLAPGANLQGLKNVRLSGGSGTARFGSIPTGKKSFFVEAYASNDGAGLPLGTGCGMATVKESGTARVTIDSVCPRNSLGQCTD